MRNPHRQMTIRTTGETRQTMSGNYDPRNSKRQGSARAETLRRRQVRALKYGQVQ